jgi:hypothetical protein
MTINYVAVLACGVASMVVGFIWYGPMFGKAWMQVMGADSMTAEQKNEMKSKMWVMYLVQFVLALITAGVLAYHIANWSSDTSALVIALCTWFGFILTTTAGAALWSGKSMKMAWKMFLLSAGAQLISFIVYGLILGAMK